MDCLIQRLNEITARLIAEEKVLKRDDQTVLACHGKLDGLETLFFGTPLHVDSPRDRTPHNRVAGNTANYNSEGSREKRNEVQLESRPSSPEQQPISNGGTVSALKQQGLLRRISKAAHDLRNRHEELKHVHDLAIIQAERAAQRILSLEARVQELESGLNNSHSSYTYLKLQLKALEAQALRYIPADDEEGLVEGFQQWKKDWRDLDGRTKVRQKRLLG
ncbi:hypothetical protein FGG08_001040 [Glutinoglossum americanum]|uniref:Uncharacterized protein n=1 Tax=Glutinoglossum americanum TaxID=1670608 RepID=A0A9P8L353_9PEZI|nr:hypothetical protein FGG08_001040 [Glutinoglossum americanum]